MHNRLLLSCAPQKIFLGNVANERRSQVEQNFSVSAENVRIQGTSFSTPLRESRVDCFWALTENGLWCLCVKRQPRVRLLLCAREVMISDVFQDFCWQGGKRPRRHEHHGSTGQISSAHHPGDYVHIRGGGKHSCHCGPANIEEGTKGDDFLHACVWSGCDWPPGDPACQPCHHRDLREGLLAGWRVAVPVLRLHLALLFRGAAQHRLRHVSGEVPGN